MQATEFFTIGQKKQVAVTVLLAMTEAIREAKRIPSGHLFAMLMEYGIELHHYQTMIDMLKRTGLVTETAAHELVWSGPEIGGAR